MRCSTTTLTVIFLSSVFWTIITGANNGHTDFFETFDSFEFDLPIRGGGLSARIGAGGDGDRGGTRGEEMGYETLWSMPFFSLVTGDDGEGLSQRGPLNEDGPSD
jgi:hypothetical protein